MTLREFARCPAVTCTPTTSVRDAAQIMAMAEVGFLVVIDDDRLAGVLTDRDIVLRVVASGRASEIPVSEVMSRPVVAVDDGATVERAATAMGEKQCRRLPVTVDGRVVGVVSLDDLLRAAGTELQQIGRAVRGSGPQFLSIP